MITAPTLRLDRDPHRGQLFQTAKRLRPRLLLLDPLVRLHGIDENHAGEVAGLLAYIRSLQRQLDLSVMLVQQISLFNPVSSCTLILESNKKITVPISSALFTSWRLESVNHQFLYNMVSIPLFAQSWVR